LLPRTLPAGDRLGYPPSMVLHEDNVFTLVAAIGAALLGWPVAAVAMTYILRSGLNEWIRKIKTIEGPAGLKASASASEQDEQAPSLANLVGEESVAAATRPAAGTQLLLLPGNASTVEVAQSLPVLMKQVIQKAATGDEESRQLFFWAAAFANEKIYRLIFGTQITALRIGSGSPEIPEVTLHALFDNSTRAGNKQTYDQWFGYLLGQSLLEKTPGGAQITVAGRVFMKFILAEAYPQDKPY